MIAALLRANFYDHRTMPWRSLTLGALMTLQNFLFFSLWIVFFGAVREVKGWQLGDVGVMFGVLAMTVGTTLFIADGVRTLTLKIHDGDIDAFLTKPCHPLPPLLLSRSNAASLGDILSGPIYWLGFGGASLAQTPALLLYSLLSATIFLASMIAFYSLGFWLKRSARFSDQLFEVMLILSCVPQHVHGMGMKVLIFSVFPVGFINLVPVTLLRSFDPGLFVLFTAVAALYMGLAIFIFNSGARKYIEARL